MHSALLNSVSITLILVPRTGFLIKADNKGKSHLHPERPDMMALRTRDASGDETVFLPRSSLKGVFRSAAERVLRSLAPGCSQRLACDPLDMKGPCHAEAGKVGTDLARGEGGRRGLFPMAKVHGMLCLACRTFGRQAAASRVRFTDVLPTAESRAAANRTAERSGVAIDRKTGGPSKSGGGKLFDLEVVTGGVYEATLQMDNVQLWQLALLGAGAQRTSLARP